MATVCDICGKEGAYLDNIRAEYRTDEIQDVCDECRSQINDHLWKLQDMTRKMNQHWLKTFMQNMKKRLTGGKDAH